MITPDLNDLRFELLKRRSIVEKTLYNKHQKPIILHVKLLPDAMNLPIHLMGRLLHKLSSITLDIP